jgi:hypothetical protein
MVHALTIFISALLLFLVQPLIGKVILPWFGGSSAVWSTSMLFFQLLLLAGYLYSHVLVRRLTHRAQVRLHLGFLAGSIALLGVNLMIWRSPILPDASIVSPLASAPWLQVFLTLASTVGVPVFVLSTTSPLVQAWFATRYGSRSKSPYPLYALSNVGSMLALLSYPFLMEPLLSTRNQAWVWSAGYLAFALGLTAVSWAILQSRDTGSLVKPLQLREAAHAVVAPHHRRIAWWHPLLWLAFSTTGSVLLLATTNQITQNVAAVPLLWVGPLAIYLLTFVIAFSGDRAYSRWTIALLFLVTQAFGSIYLANDILLPVVLSLTTYGLLLFSGCLVCHGELARLRPEAGELTRFFLVVAVGGALGGVLVNLVAPAVLTDTREFPIALLASWLFTALAVAAPPVRGSRPRLLEREWVQLSLVGVFALGIFSTFYITSQSVRAFQHSTVAAERNFYGVLRIQETELGQPPAAAYRMVHGTTIHGVQYADPLARDQALSYFGPTSGVGRALDTQRARAPSLPRRIGVLGLGVGTLAVYGQEGDVIRFYEIDPTVIRYAEGEGGYFSYLHDTPAQVDIVEGDARVALAEELARGDAQRYDLLVVDVFSGDAPPVHLLTMEAMQLYLAHLAPDGVLAVNISTTRMDLTPVLAALAQALDQDRGPRLPGGNPGLPGVVIEDIGDGIRFPSRWVILGRDPDFLDDPAWSGATDLRQYLTPRIRLWTDDYSNLVQVLR